MSIWNKTIECMPREELEKLQLSKLKDTLHYANNCSPLYKRKFSEIGFNPDDLTCLTELNKLPLTTKDDFLEGYPYGMFAVPQEKVVRIQASSGTTCKPTIVGYTKKDLENWAEIMARIVYMTGVNRSDIAQIAFCYGLFTGAHGLQTGLQNVGATVVPISGGNSEKQLMVMKDFGTTVLVSTPSYALHLAEVAEEIGLTLKRDLKVRIGLFGGEAFTEEYRKEIEERWGILATDNYGLCELGGPGISGECKFLNGQHINEDHYLVEILDPKTLEPVLPGEFGEVVITSLSREAVPVIRYRTKDISAINYEPCACGRTTARLSKIIGRSDDMMIIRGVNVFPSQIESVLLSIKELSPHYQIIRYNKGYLEGLEILIEPKDATLNQNNNHFEILEQKITRVLRKSLSISLKVKLVDPLSLERGPGKSKKIIDRRISQENK